MNFYQDNTPNGITPGDIKRKRRKEFVWKIAVGLVVLFSIGFWYVMKEYNRKPLCTASAKVDYQIVADTLIDEFETNIEVADKKYQGTVLLVEGRIGKIELKEKSYAISFENKRTPSTVLCSLDTTQDVSAIREGGRAVVKGFYVGSNRDELLGSDVILNRCVIIDKLK